MICQGLGLKHWRVSNQCSLHLILWPPEASLTPTVGTWLRNPWAFQPQNRGNHIRNPNKGCWFLAAVSCITQLRYTPRRAQTVLRSLDVEIHVRWSSRNLRTTDAREHPTKVARVISSNKRAAGILTEATLNTEPSSLFQKMDSRGQVDLACRILTARYRA